MSTMETNPLSDQMGYRLVKALYYITRTVRIHQDNNQLIRDCINDLQEIIANLSWKGDVDIKVWRGRFYVQGEKVLYKRESFRIINDMLEYFSSRGLGELCISDRFNSVLPEDVITFTRIVNESASHDDPLDWLDNSIGNNGLTWVKVSPQPEEGEETVHMQHGEKAQHAYYEAIEIVKEMAEKASKGIAGVRKARRLAQIVVDLIQEDRSLMLGLSTIRDYDDHTYTHSVNVALLATCLGKYIGLSHVMLEHLTVCGLFHDLGKVGISKNIIQKKGELSKEEWDIMQKHPLLGVRKILKMHAPHSLKSKIILGPFEHHLNPDLSGYPKTHFMKKISLIGRILKIADVYEALTAERAYRPRAFSPDEALRRMWKDGDRNFDKLLLKSFINMMGIYPIGTVVEFDNGDKGLVMGYPDEAERALPQILLLNEDVQGNITRGAMINLSTQAATPGKGSMKITRSIPASQINIEPSQFFLPDAEASYTQLNA